MAIDKGPIDETHVLILPIDHYASSLSMPPSAQAEAEAYLRALEACFAAQVRHSVFSTCAADTGQHLSNQQRQNWVCCLVHESVCECQSSWMHSQAPCAPYSCASAHEQL